MSLRSCTNYGYQEKDSNFEMNKVLDYIIGI